MEFNKSQELITNLRNQRNLRIKWYINKWTEQHRQLMFYRQLVEIESLKDLLEILKKINRNN